MKNIFMESGVVSLNKSGEDICGDYVTTVSDEAATTIVLSDGLGSGVKANILATLTSKILATMIAENIPIEDCVNTYAKALPVCKVRKMAYSTFTVFKAEKNGRAYLAQFDNPEAILLRGGKVREYPVIRKIVAEKEICESSFLLEKDDVLILLSDGVTHAGLGKVMPSGWPRSDIICFLEDIYKPEYSPKHIAIELGSACRDLYMDHIDDDTTIAVFRIRECSAVNLIIGPPKNREDDEKVLRLFFSKEGRHIVCGGTTARMVSRFLNRELTVETESYDPSIPPAGHIDDVDLVTEGILTMGRVVKMAKEYTAPDFLPEKRKKGNDAASRIAVLLFEEATDIHFFVGTAVNPSHQNPDLNIDFTIKMGIIDELTKLLETMGKRVKISRC